MSMRKRAEHEIEDEKCKEERQIKMKDEKKGRGARGEGEINQSENGE
jgi:hypothetical protein